MEQRSVRSLTLRRAYTQSTRIETEFLSQIVTEHVKFVVPQDRLLDTDLDREVDRLRRS